MSPLDTVVPVKIRDEPGNQYLLAGPRSSMSQSGKQKTPPPVRSVADKPEHREFFRKLIAESQLHSAGGPTQRIELPGRYLTLEQPPLSAFDDNPVFDESCAARFLGLSTETLKKWRQRNFGPDYIQYGPAGPVRYTFNALMDFRDTHTVKPARKKM
jgi:hypothetical protein